MKDQKNYTAAPEPERKRCEYCDGTGDVTSIDGEWRGVCNMCDWAQPEQNPFPHEAMDKVAAERYKVAKSVSTIWPYAVVAGDGNQELFHGRESTCKHVARKLVGAFLDGAFYAQAQWQKELEASTCYMTNDATRDECIRQAIEADRAQPERKPAPMHEGEIQAAWIGQDLDEPIPYTFVLGVRSAERFNGILPAPEDK